MTIIKQRNASHVIKDAVVLDLGDLRRQANEIMVNADNEAARVLEEARKTAEQIKTDAEKRGYEEGLARGTQQGIEEGKATGHEQALNESAEALEKLRQHWTSAIEQWERDRHDLLSASREDVLRFAIVLAEKIVCRAIEVDPSLVINQVEDALMLIAQPGRVVIEVNPSDVPLIEEALPQLQQRLADAAHIELRPSETIERGGCVLRTNLGTIDATIPKQMERIIHTLLPTPEVNHQT